MGLCAPAASFPPPSNAGGKCKWTFPPPLNAGGTPPVRSDKPNYFKHHFHLNLGGSTFNQAWVSCAAVTHLWVYRQNIALALMCFDTVFANPKLLKIHCDLFFLIKERSCPSEHLEMTQNIQPVSLTFEAPYRGRRRRMATGG